MGIEPNVWHPNGRFLRLDWPPDDENHGTESWYDLHLHHCVDGPAVAWENGEKEWWIMGKNITSEVEEWMKRKEITWPFDEEAKVEFLLTWT